MVAVVMLVMVVVVVVIIMFVMVAVVMLVMVVVVVVVMMFVMMMARTVGQFCKTEEAASRCGSACLKAECQPHYHDDDEDSDSSYPELDCGLQDCFDLFANMG